MTYPN